MPAQNGMHWHAHNCKKDWLFNPLTTDDESTRHATLVACYQLAQSVLKIGNPF